MGRCVVCKSLLPPDFLFATPDGLARKCIFCDRGTDTIKYMKDGKEEQTTKAETIREYQELLKELSDTPSVKDVIDTIRTREAGGGIILK